MGHIISTLCLIFFLILIVGFFTSSETAYLSLSKVKLRSMLEEGKKNAKIVAKLKGNIDRLLTTVLIGTNFFNSLVSALATALAFELLKGSPLANFTPFITAYFITTFGQIIPKTIAGIHTEKVACTFSWPLKILETIFFPLVWLFERISHFVVWLIEKIIKPTGQIITEEELRTLILVGENEGTLEKGESKMLNKLIKFNDLTVNDIMKHRSFVKMVDGNCDYETTAQEFLKTGYSTLAVYKEKKENVIGVIHYQDVLYSDENSDLGIGFAERTMKSVIFVPGTFSVLDILTKFKQEEYKFAVVLNEQGETAGIITMEDIIRVVFDRMTNENSYNNLPPEDKIKLVSLNTFSVPGDLKLDDVNEILNVKLESDNCMTLGGWILEQFGFLPSIGEVLIKDGNIFEIEDVVQRRITSVKIKVK